MPQIHLPSSNIQAPAKIHGWQWLPYRDAKLLDNLKRAIALIDKRIKGNPTCEKAFANLKKGRSFSEVWNDPSVWISYDPDKSGTMHAVVIGNHMTLTAYTLAMGQWTTAATIIHELAHVNGAPGGNSSQAEDILLECLLKDLHNPAYIGRLGKRRSYSVA